MPNYDYRCENCGHQTTKFQKISEEKLKTCKECSCDTLRRLIGGSMATLSFEGSGYYITDYGPKKGAQTEPKPTTT